MVSKLGKQKMSGRHFEQFRKGTTIQTLQGGAEYICTETENAGGRWHDDYSTNDGYFVIHEGYDHIVYKVK